MTLPDWWLGLSAAFFAVNILIFIALIVTLVYVIKAINALTPKVQAIEEKVQDVAKKVEDVAATVKETVENVGGRAKNVVGSVEHIAHTAGRQFERFSPFIIGALTAIRLITVLNQARKPKALTARAEQEVDHKNEKKKKGNPLLSLLRL